MVPSTFIDCHVGSSSTFVSAHGFDGRLDFIAIDHICGEGIGRSWVNDDIDFLNGDRDHKVLCQEVGLRIGTSQQQGARRVPLYDRSTARQDPDKKGAMCVCE